MFTGIIEDLAEVISLREEGANITFEIESKLAHELKVDQSVAHNGVCLTVVNVKGNTYDVTAVHETLKKSNLGNWAMGDKINLERCMLNNGRFDGHIVQGHVDQIGTCTRITPEEGSWVFDFEYDKNQDNVTVEKGSVTVNGISLTCFNSENGKFSVAIIPYTYEHTNLHTVEVGHSVNLEFDIIGKYVKRLLI